MKYFSKSAKGFYDSRVNLNLPEDAVEISEADHAALMAAQGAGKVLDWSGAAPVAVDYVPQERTPDKVRDDKLRSLVHDYGDGRVIQCRDPAFAEDESRMRNAIELMERHGITERIWYMADNTTGTVTVADLWAAIHSGQDQADAAWAEFFATIGGGA